MFGTISADRQLDNVVLTGTLAARNLAASSTGSSTSRTSSTPLARYVGIGAGLNTLPAYDGVTIVYLDSEAGPSTINLPLAEVGQRIVFHLRGSMGGSSVTWNAAGDDVINYFIPYDAMGVGFYTPSPDTTPSTISFTLHGDYAGHLEFVADASGSQWKVSGFIQT